VQGADDRDARVGEPAGGREAALAAGVDGYQVIDAGHLGVPGQHRVGVERGTVADQLQALEQRAHALTAAAVNGRDDHV
jgi:hypothetical protein